MILGLDISTSITGATVLDSTGICVYNEYWDTRNKNQYPTIYHKAHHVKKHLQGLYDKYKFEHVFVEQSLQSFRSGFSSAQTLSTLSRFNGMISWMCWDMFGHEPQMLAATSARKQVGIKVSKGEKGKDKSFDFVVANEPAFVVEYTKNGNIKPGIMDKSDSWVIAKAGYILCTAKN